jgi:hypothetical protein
MMSIIEEDEKLRDTHYGYFRGCGPQQMVSRINADIHGPRAAWVRRGAQSRGMVCVRGSD